MSSSPADGAESGLADGAESGPADTPSSQGFVVPRPATSSVTVKTWDGRCSTPCFLHFITSILLVLFLNFVYVLIYSQYKKRYYMPPVWVALLISFATGFVFEVFVKCVPIKTWMYVLMTSVLIFTDVGLIWVMATISYPSDKAAE